MPTPAASTAAVISPIVAARIRAGVSHAPARARNQALIPDAVPTATAAVAAHCTHMGSA